MHRIHLVACTTNQRVPYGLAGFRFIVIGHTVSCRECKFRQANTETTHLGNSRTYSFFFYLFDLLFPPCSTAWESPTLVKTKPWEQTETAHVQVRVHSGRVAKIMVKVVVASCLVCWVSSGCYNNNNKCISNALNPSVIYVRGSKHITTVHNMIYIMHYGGFKKKKKLIMCT